MLYSAVHLVLLLMATSGLWLVRRRKLLFVVGLVLLPLPPALFNYVAAPLAQTAADIVAPDCAGSARPSDRSEPASPGDNDEGDPQDDCMSRLRSARVQTVAVIFIVNFLTVGIGFLAGLLCLASLRHIRRPS